jgi:hypothetical protein
MLFAAVAGPPTLTRIATWPIAAITRQTIITGRASNVAALPRPTLDRRSASRRPTGSSDPTTARQTKSVTAAIARVRAGSRGSSRSRVTKSAISWFSTWSRLSTTDASL